MSLVYHLLQICQLSFFNNIVSQILLVFFMISGAKGQKAVHACMIRLLNLGPAEHAEVAIYTVNQRIPNVRELREQLRCEAIRRYLLYREK